MKVTDKTGPVVGAVTVVDSDELMLMTSTGQSIRIRVNEIRETGRNAQGVKLLTLKDGEKLQDISLVIPDGEDAEGTVTPPAENEPSDEVPSDEVPSDEVPSDEVPSDEVPSDEVPEADEDATATDEDTE
jgi:DNA gyrase subunit A